MIAGGDATRSARTRRRHRRPRLAPRQSPDYAELELRREDYWKKTSAYTRIVATAAFANPVFHYNGQFAAAVALRNLYIEETGLGAKGLSLWAGSRTYRGDDIYLLNFWPLDNLNTIGGGLGYAFGKGQRTSIRVHAGLDHRPTLTIVRASCASPRTTSSTTPRSASSTARSQSAAPSLTHMWPLSGTGGSGGIKGIVYGEFHYVPGGQREKSRPSSTRNIPKDTGFVAGGQLTLFTGKRSTYVTATGRFAYGLAAYGEFNAPRRCGPDRKTTGAYEMMLTLSGNWERGPFAIMAGGYYRQFRNASKPLDFDNVNEGIVITHPDRMVRREGRPLARGLVPGPASAASPGRPRPACSSRCWARSAAPASSPSSPPAAAATSSARTSLSCTCSPPATAPPARSTPATTCTPAASSTT